MSKKDFEKIKPVLRAIPEDKVMTPRIPVDTLLQEASDLMLWARDDARKLSFGFTNQIGALQYVESLWNSERHGQHETSEKWEKMLAFGRTLRKELKHTFRYAFRKESGLIITLREINRGRTHADLIRDLSDLAVIGESNLPMLKKVGFNPGQIERS